ncbi:hypothetical protein KC734_21650 [candidate division KSB1 bacterium]|nr:hypothetical protein [candidate division KSB1 bacterium]
MSLPSIIYNIFVIPLLYIGFHVLSLFHAKVRRGIRGRKALFDHLRQKFAEQSDRTNRVLIHAASMGEFEQARPILRTIRERYPDALLCVSVFSPSAFDHLKQNSEIDILTYLPFDSRKNVLRFLQIVNPSVIIFIRYDLWPNLVWQAHKRGIYTVLIDASLQQTSWRQKPVIRQFNQAIFAKLDLICAISEQAAEHIRTAFVPYAPVIATGDTRFDQVVFRAKEKQISEIFSFPVDNWLQSFVAGSTWPEDESIVLTAFAKLCQQQVGARLILASHEPSENHLAGCERLCKTLKLRTVRLSRNTGTEQADVLLIDRIGILANLYAAASVAFVGGSFGPGVHNVIEPAAHSAPVLFGPQMHNSPEAVDMTNAGCGTIVRNADELYGLLQRLYTDSNLRNDLAERARQFVAARTGADRRIIELIHSKLSI